MSVSFDQLRAANVRRYEESCHALRDWSVTDWACAMGGEAGEALNVAKKLRRLADGPDRPYNRGVDPEALRRQLAEELADLVIDADLLAAQDIDLGLAVIEKFNRTSVKVGAYQRL